MKNLNKSIAATLVATSVLLGSAFYVQAGEMKTDKEMAVLSATVPLEKALSIAKSTLPGIVTKIEFDDEKGTGVWEIEIIDTNKVNYDIEIDATSGKVMSQKIDKNDDEDEDDENENENENDEKDNN